MKLRVFSLYILVSLYVVYICHAQTIDEEGTWDRAIGKQDRYLSRFVFDTYTKTDAVNARNRYLRIEKSGFKSEWEGAYVTNTETGEANLVWNASEGYVYTYIYHWLATLDYGHVLFNGDSIRLSSSKTVPKHPLFLTSEPFVKVRLGSKHFLVAKSALREFGARVGGRETSDTFMSGYFFREDEMKLPSDGVPVFPKEFQKLVTDPIVTKIIGIGRKQIHQDKLEDGTVNYEEIYRPITLGAGRDKGVKVGMDFYIDDLDEWAEVTHVGFNTAIAKFRRDFDDKRQEQCRNYEGGNGDLIPCRPIKIGLQARTKRNDL